MSTTGTLNRARSFASNLPVISGLMRQWEEGDPDNKAISKGVLVVAIFIFFAKLAGAAKEMAVAWRYGVGPIVDAYLFIFNVVNWPVGIWFSVITVVLIPLTARMTYGDPEELPVFRSQFLGFTLLVGIVTSVVFSTLLPHLLHDGFFALPKDTNNLALEMVPGLSWLPFLGIAVSYFSVLTMSAGKHANTLFEGLPSLTILLSVALLGGVFPLLFGTLVGTLLQALSLLVPLIRLGLIQRPTISFSSKQWPLFWQGFGIIVLGQCIMSITAVIDQFFAARLDQGAISMLGYANRVLSLILTLGATAISRATLPVFSRGPSEQGLTTATSHHYLAMKWVKVMFIFGTVTAAVAWVAAPLLIKILFERGAFIPTNTASVTAILRLSLLQVPAYFSSLVLVSYFAGIGGQKKIAAMAIINLGAKIPLAMLLIPRLGLSGLVISTALMYTVSGVSSLLMLRRWA